MLSVIENHRRRRKRNERNDRGQRMKSITKRKMRRRRSKKSKIPLSTLWVPPFAISKKKLKKKNTDIVLQPAITVKRPATATTGSARNSNGTRTSATRRKLAIEAWALVVQGQLKQCPSEELDQCLQLADPFIQDPKFVFPTSMPEIQSMCSAWTRFTDCVRSYVVRCLTVDQRQEFDRAVQESEETMQQMCTQPRYQAEYLENARCIKQVCVQPEHCGERYAKLVTEVSSQLNQDALCCHYSRFRSCVLSLSVAECSASASNFAHHMLDKAMGFLLRNCRDTIQSESVDSCPPGSRDDVNAIGNSLGPGLSQAGSGQLPAAMPPSQPTRPPQVRWTYDPNPSNNGIAPESLQGRSDASATHPYFTAFAFLISWMILSGLL